MGADEIFLVPMNGLILDNQWEKVEAELRGCKEAAGQIPITLIMELQVFDAEPVSYTHLDVYKRQVLVHFLLECSPQVAIHQS